MTWIKTIPLSEADEKLRHAMEGSGRCIPRSMAIRCTRMSREGRRLWGHTR
jgi:hypothetical protein